MSFVGQIFFSCRNKQGLENKLKSTQRKKQIENEFHILSRERWACSEMGRICEKSLASVFLFLNNEFSREKKVAKVFGSSLGIVCFLKNFLHYFSKREQSEKEKGPRAEGLQR